nr:hypothetical protein [Tanacetum cinerariifolium]
PEPLESIVLWNPSIRKSVRPEPLESIVLWNPSIKKSIRIGIPKLPRKNGDAIIETIEDDDHFVLQVYDPCLERISGDLGMEGSYFSFSVRSYKEMLLLLDE